MIKKAKKISLFKNFYMTNKYLICMLFKSFSGSDCCLLRKICDKINVKVILLKKNLFKKILLSLKYCFPKSHGSIILFFLNDLFLSFKSLKIFFLKKLRFCCMLNKTLTVSKDVFINLLSFGSVSELYFKLINLFKLILYRLLDSIHMLIKNYDSK